LYDWIGFFIVLIVALVITAGPIAHRFPKRLEGILIVGLLAHAAGSIVRYMVLYLVYDGGDAGRYYRMGLTYAEFLWRLDFTFLDPYYWEYAKLLGTQATIFISSFVLTFIGPTIRGEFLAFALLSFFGLILFCKAFYTNFPQSDLVSYARFLLLWPSLWFWPGSVGKDSLILLATALVVYGYSVKRTRVQWFTLILGLTLAGLVRPPVAGIMVVSLAIAHWISPWKKWTAAHFIQGVLILVLLGTVLTRVMGSMGMEEIDMDSLKTYVEKMNTKSTGGGSHIGAPSMGITGVPVAIINILFRPFPWEATSIFAAAASAELLLFWTLIFIRRKRVIALAVQWRTTRLLRLGVPLTILYVVALGMAAGNLGLIARQRIHILPLLLIWLEARPFPLKEVSRVPATPPVGTAIASPLAHS
jgi:hypothetical protein